MARGKRREVGSVRVAPNGYRYVQTEQGQRLLHHVLAETKLGRPLRADERVYFVDGDRTHVEVDNLDVRSSSRSLNRIYLLMKRVEKLEQEASDIRQALRDTLESELEERGKSIDSLESN